MLDVETTMETILTGVREIADVLCGGIKGGSLAIVEGESKSGKSVLTQHLIYDALSSPQNTVAYYTTDHNVSALIDQMESMSQHVKDYFLSDRLRIIPLSLPEARRDAPRALRFLSSHMSELPERFNLVVVDSITPLMNRVNPALKMDFLQKCKELCEDNRSIFLTASSHTFEKRTLSRIYALSDYYLRPRSGDAMIMEGMVDKRIIKVLQVLKLHGADCQTIGTVTFEIKPKVGIRILPFVRIRV